MAAEASALVLGWERGTQKEHVILLEKKTLIYRCEVPEYGIYRCEVPEYCTYRCEVPEFGIYRCEVVEIYRCEVPYCSDLQM